MKKFLRGFKHAMHGISYTYRTQRNMRIHITIAALVWLFAVAYGISEAQRMLLLCMTALVIVAEAVNTAIEKAVDMAIREFHPIARAAKDAAAGAVLISALFAVISAGMIFLDSEKLTAAFNVILSDWRHILAFAAIAICGLTWIIFGGKNIDNE